jgi:DNA repair protein RadC
LEFICHKLQKGDSIMNANRLVMSKLPGTQKPREKVLLYGTDKVEVRDLLAIMLNTGTRSTSALMLADSLLAKFGSLLGLSEASIEELTTVHGVGTVKAVRIAAACEIGRRLRGFSNHEKLHIRQAEDVAGLLMDEMRHLDREEFRGVFLDAKNQVLEIRTVAVGNLHGALVHPREVYKNAVRRSCAAVIMVHNHPSGDPTPSDNDIAVTRRLKKAGEVLGIELLDHLIIGDGNHVSLKESGYF